MNPFPCPFCGSSEVEVVFYNCPCVVCRKCDSDGPGASTIKPDSDREALKVQAIELWNRRAKLPDQLEMMPVAGKRKASKPASAWGLDMADWFNSLLFTPFILTSSARSNWGRCFDALVEIDKRDEDEISAVIQWARSDDFWGRNFLSPCKLREKKDGVSFYDKFRIAMNAQKKKTVAGIVGSGGAILKL